MIKVTLWQIVSKRPIKHQLEALIFFAFWHCVLYDRNNSMVFFYLKKVNSNAIHWGVPWRTALIVQGHEFEMCLLVFEFLSCIGWHCCDSHSVWLFPVSTIYTTSFVLHGLLSVTTPPPQSLSTVKGCYGCWAVAPIGHTFHWRNPNFLDLPNKNLSKPS